MSDTNLAIDYLTVFGSPTGTRVLDDLKRRAHYGRTILTAPGAEAPIDPIRTWVQEGKRVLLLEILAEMERARRGLTPVPGATRSVQALTEVETP